MKSIFALLLLTGLSAQAQQINKANKAERAYLCAGVEKLLEADHADAALDKKDCLKKAKMTSSLLSEGLLVVNGTVKIKNPSGYEMTAQCSFAHDGQVQKGKIIQEVLCN